MSRETESALTPEEWRQRGFAESTAGHPYDRPEHWDGQRSPALFCTADGVLCYADDSLNRAGWELDARKVMALANLSLTLEKKEGAITQADVDVCTSAAWYFRKMARDSEAKRDNGQDSTSAYEHEQALIGAGKLATALAAKLRALVPPE